MSGSGATHDSTGLGNPVIGYDDDTDDLATIDAERDGSHNLIIDDDNTFTSGGGLVGERDDGISDEYATVGGGQGNAASGPYTSISGGDGNLASGNFSSVAGGENASASLPFHTQVGNFDFLP